LSSLVLSPFFFLVDGFFFLFHPGLVKSPIDSCTLSHRQTNLLFHPNAGRPVPALSFCLLPLFLPVVLTLFVPFYNLAVSSVYDRFKFIAEKYPEASFSSFVYVMLFFLCGLKRLLEFASGVFLMVEAG